MKRVAISSVILLFVLVILDQSAFAAAQVWANTGSDYNTGANWNAGAGPAPGPGDVARFTAAAVAQPNISVSVSNAGLYFNGTGVSGYDITGSAGVSLTLTGRSTTGSGGTSDSSAAAIRADNTSGTNTIDVPLILAPSTGPSTFFLANGGTLVVNSVISDAGAGKALSIKNGTLQLNNNNTFSGGTSIDAASTVILGNDGAVGTGAFTVSSTSTLQASGAARTLANSIAFGGTTTFSGSNSFTFNGAASTTGANSRTITVGNTGGITFGSTFTINGNSGPGTVLFNGTTAVTLNGVVQDGAFGSSVLSHSGTGTLTLTNSNTYSGGTTLSGGTTISTQNGAFGSGSVSLTASNVTLTLQGVTNSIADTANFSIGIIAGNSGDVVNLNFNGTETVNTLSVNGTPQQPGIYGPVGSGAQFELSQLMGTGTLNVLSIIPEPATYMLMGLGILICAQTFRRKRS